MKLAFYTSNLYFAKLCAVLQLWCVCVSHTMHYKKRWLDIYKD